MLLCATVRSASALCFLLHVLEAFEPFSKHFALVLALGRVQSLAGSTIGVALLKCEVHFTCHTFGVLNEVFVVVHGNSALLATL